MKKLFKRKSFWVIIVIVILIIIGVAAKLSGGGPSIEYVTAEVQRGQLTQTVTATGAVESAHDIDLNFKATGKLVFLTVDEGDKVKAGQVLARLDGAGLSAQVDQYRANLASVQADLAKVVAGASVQDIRVLEEKVAKAENDLNNLEIERDTQLQIFREKTLDAANNAVYTAQVSLDVVYNHLINDNLTANLQVNNGSLLNGVETEYYQLDGELDSVQIDVDTANNQKTNNSITTAADSTRNVLSDLNDFLNDAYSVADSIVLNNSYSQTDKDGIKSDIDTEQSTNNTSLTSLQTAKANLVNNVNSYQSSIQAAENNLLIYQAELDLKRAGARDFEIQAAEAKVAQARAQLNKALADLNDYGIVAPIDGTITKVNFSIGEQTNLSEPVIKMLSTEKFEIKVDIPESDIAKIKVGDETVIELDAFGSDQLFSGAITFIDPAQTVIQDVTYYRTTVGFNEDDNNEQIKPGMTADVTITTAEKDDVLFIPQRAVKIKEASLGEVAVKFVEVLVSEQETEEIIVTVGLRGDGGMVEILSGLEEGENVVTFKKENK